MQFLTKIPYPFLSAAAPKTLGVRVPQIDRGAYALMPESSIQYDKSRGGKVMNATTSSFVLSARALQAAPLLKMILTFPPFLYSVSCVVG